MLELNNDLAKKDEFLGHSRIPPERDLAKHRLRFSAYRSEFPSRAFTYSLGPDDLFLQVFNNLSQAGKLSLGCAQEGSTSIHCKLSSCGSPRSPVIHSLGRLHGTLACFGTCLVSRHPKVCESRCSYCQRP